LYLMSTDKILLNKISLSGYSQSSPLVKGKQGSNRTAHIRHIC
jgi:hypothetical protein